MKQSVTRTSLHAIRYLAVFLFRHSPGPLLARVAVATVQGCQGTLQAALLAVLVDYLGTAPSPGAATPHALPVILIAVMLSLSVLIPPLYEHLFKVLWFDTSQAVTLTLAARYSELDIAHLESPEKRDLLQRIEEQGQWKVPEAADQAIYAVESLIGFAVALAGLLVVAPWATAVVLIAMVPELIVEIRLSAQVWGIWHARVEVRRRYWDIWNRFGRTSEMTEMRLFRTAPFFLRLLSQLFDSFQSDERRAQHRKIVWQLAARVIALIALVCVLVPMIFDSGGSVTTGNIVFVLGAVLALRNSLSQLFRHVGRFAENAPFVVDITTLLELPPALPRPAVPVVLMGESPPEIRFENVSFAYPGKDEEILHDLSFVITPGERVSLVGINGAGKTTLVKLLCRFYDPTAGRILLDGHDLKRIDLESWYRRLGVLFQEYSRYYFQAGEAISLGDRDRTREESRIEDAAWRSGATDFIRAWPQGLGQQLGRQFADGVEPSVGQWQKLALARLFYRDAPVLILDEPTASIDAEGEERIFEELTTHIQGNTLILISHRFATVRKAEKILVLEEGRITETGSHADLLSFGGTYAKLFRLQAKGYGE